jgi:hypothetical protein
MLQIPPQQSLGDAHTSPFWPQYEATAHTFIWQCMEQQSPSTAHGLPSVLHMVLSGVHVPPAPQLPLQQLAPEVHGMPSAMQALNSQMPPLHVPKQHTVAAVHTEPSGVHALAEASPPRSTPTPPSPGLWPALLQVQPRLMDAAAINKTATVKPRQPRMSTSLANGPLGWDHEGILRLVDDGDAGRNDVSATHPGQQEKDGSRRRRGGDPIGCADEAGRHAPWDLLKRRSVN